MGGISHYVRFFAAALFSVGLLIGDLYFSAFTELRSNMSLALVPFRAAATFPWNAYNTTADYLQSREKLLAEKGQLEQQIIENTINLKSFDFYLQQNEQLRENLNLAKRQSGKWLVAEFGRHVSYASTPRVSLNKGVEDGVLLGMAVVDKDGVIGQVVRADINTCIVSLLSEQGQWISTRNRRNNLLVILRGNGAGRLNIEYVTNDADLKVGDELLASGGVYPPGYPVAVVEEISTGPVYQQGLARAVSNFSNSSLALLYFSEQATAEQTDSPILNFGTEK